MKEIWGKDNVVAWLGPDLHVAVGKGQLAADAAHLNAPNNRQATAWKIPPSIAMLVEMVADPVDDDLVAVVFSSRKSELRVHEVAANMVALDAERV